MTPAFSRSSAPTPSARRWTTRLRSFDEAAMNMAVQDGVLEHVQLAPGRFRGDIAHTDAGPGATRLDWGAYDVPVFARGDLSPDRLTIGLAIAGRGAWRGHGRPVRLGNIAIFPEGGELDVALPTEAQWLTFHMPRARLEAAGLRIDGRAGGSLGRVAGRLSPDSWRALDELASVLSPFGCTDPDDVALVAAHAQLSDLLLAEVARRSGDAGVGRALAPAERWQLVRRVDEYLQDHEQPPVRIDELCTATQTSVSRLERAFRDAFNVGPCRFFTLRRFAGARRMLQRGDDTASVTDVATRWGFFHLGRFATEYRLLYGERPSETRAAARGTRAKPLSPASMRAKADAA